MSKTKRKRKKKRGSALSGIPPSNGRQLSMKESLGWGLLTAVLGAGSGGLGAALGPWSIPLGLASVIYGTKRNDQYSKFLIASGVGLLAGTTVKKAAEGTNGIEDDMQGFDFTSMAERSKLYFKTLADKFTLPIGKGDESTNGLNGDEVNYFVNPYTTKNLNQLDKIQSQIEQMSGHVQGIGEVDPAERNY